MSDGGMIDPVRMRDRQADAAVIEAELLEGAMPAIREAVIATLPAADHRWVEMARAGRFDGEALMVAAIAGWRVRHG